MLRGLARVAVTWWLAGLSPVLAAAAQGPDSTGLTAAGVGTASSEGFAAPVDLIPHVGLWVDGLAEVGFVRELNGKRRNRQFAYREYLALLDQGTEPLAP